MHLLKRYSSSTEITFVTQKQESMTVDEVAIHHEVEPLQGFHSASGLAHLCNHGFILYFCSGHDLHSLHQLRQYCGKFDRQ